LERQAALIVVASLIYLIPARRVSKSHRDAATARGLPGKGAGAKIWNDEAGCYFVRNVIFRFQAPFNSVSPDACTGALQIG